MEGLAACCSGGWRAAARARPGCATEVRLRGLLASATLRGTTTGQYEPKSKREAQLAVRFEISNVISRTRAKINEKQVQEKDSSIFLIL